MPDVNQQTTEQTEALATEQLEALTTSDVSALTTEQVEALTTTDVAALTTSQVDALVTEQVAALVTIAVAALVTEQVDAIAPVENTALATISTEQAKATEATVEAPQSDLDKLRTSILGSDNYSLRATVNVLDAYVEAMHPPRPQTPQSIAQHQSNLYRTLIKALESDGQEFIDQWKTILAYFKEHTMDGKVLNALYMNRGANFIHQNIGISAAASFSNLLHICTVAHAETTFESFKKQIDPKRAFEGLSQKAIKNLSQFYRL